MKHLSIFVCCGLLAGCGSLTSRPNRVQYSAPAPYQAPAPEIKPRARPLDAIPVQTGIAAERMFRVQSSDRTVSDLLNRWAQQEGLLFAWQPNYDYPITPPMRDISATSLTGALASMRTALRGVARPLLISPSDQLLTVRAGADSRTAAVTGKALLPSIAASQQTAMGTLAPSPEATIPPPPAPPAPPTPEWFLTPEDQFLSVALARWSEQARFKLAWTVDADYPITAKQPRRYSGPFLDAVGSVLSDLSKGGTDLSYTLVGNDLTIKRKGL